MPNLTFSIEEMLQIQSGTVSEELKGRIEEAQTFEKTKGLRDKVKAAFTTNAQGFIDSKLKSLSIPSGVKELSLIFDYAVETASFNVRSSGVSVSMASEGSVSEDLIKLVTKAEEAKTAKNGQPLAFIVKTLGEARVSHVATIRDFNDSVKPSLDALYTAEQAKDLASGVTEIPAGDKAQIRIKYSSEIDADGNKQAGWLAPDVKVSKTLASGGGSGNGRKKRVSAPEGYASWRVWMETSKDELATKILNAQISKYGADWTSSISPTNALRAGKHPLIIAADEQNGD